MHSGIRYTILFVAVALLQALVFNQVQISVWFNPLIYMAFVILRYVPIVLTLLRILSQMNVGFCQMLFLHILRSSYDSNSSFCECGVSC